MRKLKILWLCNIVLPELCEEFGLRKPFAGGWLTGMWDELKKDSQYELAICVPIIDTFRAKDGQFDGYGYYSFQWNAECENQTPQIQRFKEIIKDFEPDIVHIWGTEYIHSNSMVKACQDEKMVERALVNIQGILYKCTENYKFGLDPDYSDGILESMLRRQKYEVDTLTRVCNVSGRTKWDRSSVMEINPKLNYYHCGEVLRESFYSRKRWNVNDCEKHTVLVSQANYPIKGFHLIISQLAELVKMFPNLKVRVCGKKPIDGKNTYGEKLYQLIAEYELEEIIEFVGPKSEQEMLKEYLNTNVFLSASIIENSSNSVCEALALGVPVVSSNVGGMESIIEDSYNGFLYSLGDEDKAVEAAKLIFENQNVAQKLSENALVSSTKINGKQECIDTLKSIYSSIYRTTLLEV